jgi:hypothetical protein
VDGARDPLRLRAVGSTDVAGLALLQTHSFRVCVTIARTTGPWTQAVSLLVH